MTSSPRVDPFVNELLTKITGLGAEPEAQEAYLLALRETVDKAGAKVGGEQMAKVGVSLINLLSHEEAQIRRLSSQILGFFARYASETQLNNLIENQFLAKHGSWEQKQSACIGLRFLLLSDPKVFSKFDTTILQVVLNYIRDEKPMVRSAAAEALEALILLPDIANNNDLLPKMLQTLRETLSDESHDVIIVSLKALKKFSKLYPKIISQHLSLFVPVLMTRIKERINFAVQLAAERTMLHVLQLHSNPKILEEYVNTLDPNQAKSLTDYCKRVLSKLSAEESDDDEEEENN